jgi:tetratricopeptide (TPR) repeat protein
VYYYSAYLHAEAGETQAAFDDVNIALRLRPASLAAQRLLLTLSYSLARYDDAIKLADKLIASKSGPGELPNIWLVKGLSQRAQGDNTGAISTLGNACSLFPDDEFIRTALEETLLTTTVLENPLRRRWAQYHFTQADAFRARKLSGEAVYEYRRGLRINPYAPERKNYADLLRIQGYPELYYDQLTFITGNGTNDQSVKDIIEKNARTQANTLINRNSVQPSEVRPRWNVAVFALPDSPVSAHADSSTLAAEYLKDVLQQGGKVNTVSLPEKVPNFSAAFRQARGVSDYFLIVQLTENGADGRGAAFTINAYVSSTGSPAAKYRANRTGPSRFTAAIRDAASAFTAALPFRASLIRRNAAIGLIDKGKIDGVKLPPPATAGAAQVPAAQAPAAGQAAPEAPPVYTIIRARAAVPKDEGLGLSYVPEDVVGTFIPAEVSDTVTRGSLTRQGFFDSIAPGDDIFVLPPPEDSVSTAPINAAAPPAPPQTPAADPALRALLRSLRDT